jgi:Transglutaminase-like superfamily
MKIQFSHQKEAGSRPPPAARRLLIVEAINELLRAAGSWLKRSQTVSVSLFPIIISLSFLLNTQAFAVTLEQLQQDPQLTPSRFARYFSDFEFRFHREVQPPEVFLESKAGDCDDYAILADRVLRARGYHTRLVHVGMPGGPAHVVCYVAEEKGYLDYNNRSYFFKIERSGSTLPEIAGRVAKSFKSEWNTVTEFTSIDGHKRLVETVFKVSPRRGELVEARSSTPALAVLLTGGGR